ncbi:MAG: hypothetical protein WC742_11655 [Gallionellaceae bacterium]
MKVRAGAPNTYIHLYLTKHSASIRLREYYRGLPISFPWALVIPQGEIHKNGHIPPNTLFCADAEVQFFDDKVVSVGLMDIRFRKAKYRRRRPMP